MESSQAPQMVSCLNFLATYPSNTSVKPMVTNNKKSKILFPAITNITGDNSILDMDKILGKVSIFNLLLKLLRIYIDQTIRNIKGINRLLTVNLRPLNSYPNF